MGSHMANNLIRAGYNLVVHDINLNAMKKFSEKGVTTKETPMEVMKSSDVVITMVPSASHVLDVYTGSNGLLHSGKLLRPWLFIDSSTVDPQTSRKLSSSISECSLEEKRGLFDHPVMLDAPVSGGVLGAEAATLTFMVGGLENAYLAAKSLLLAMGKRAIYCGGAGNGVAAKICNNLAMAVTMLGISEAFALGQSLGITANTLTNIFNSSSARCWSSDIYNPVPGVMEGVPSSRNYDGGFSSKLMAKDLELAEASAKEVGFNCRFTAQAREIYTSLCKEGLEYKDFSCVFRHYYSGKDEISKGYREELHGQNEDS
ncbi:probable 3-hydroxyisobutyrate dehydrogenase, mitochondrial isoform X2 [Aristolochia californica]